MSLMEMSFSGAVLILVILAVRALLKNRLPRMTFAALWMIALLRLLIPFSISSAWSVYTVLPDAAFIKEQELTDQGRIFNQELPPEQNQDSSPFYEPAPGKESIEGEPMPNLSVWKVIWAAGFVLCAGFFSWVYCRCYREFQMSLPIDDGILGGWYSAHPLKRKLSIRQSDQITSPLSYGVWRPVILLPKSTRWEDRFQLRYVLEHEYVHIQHFDAAVKLLMVAALCMHWFNPPVWLMYIFFNRDLELFCDETVVRRFGEEEKSAYAMTLIEMEEEKSGLLPLGNNFSKNAIEERIRAIMKLKKSSLLAQGLAVVLVCGITLLFATSCGASGEAEEITEADMPAVSFAAEDTIKGIVVEETYASESGIESVQSDMAEVISKNREFTEYRNEIASEATASETMYDSADEVKSSIPEEYAEFGVTSDKRTNRWMYQGKGVAVIYDKDNGIYTNDSISEGKAVYLEVRRDKKGRIIELHKVTKKEMQKLVEED